MANFGNLKTLCRLTVPEAKSNRINNSSLELVINEVTIDVNSRLKLLRDDEKFNVAADKQKYDLSSSSETVERFFKIDAPGLWWNAGSASSPNWKPIYLKTDKWLDNNWVNWRNLDSGDPRYCYKQGKYLVIVPTPDTTLADGFWLYFIQKTMTMSKSGHYPFGYDNEIPEYAFLTDVIMKGVESWLKPPVGKKPEGTQAMKEYLALIADKEGILQRNLYFQNEKDVKMRFPKPC